MCNFNRREFLSTTVTGLGTLILPDWVRAAGGAPSANPAAHLGLAWTSQFKWANIVDITKVTGLDWHEKLESAQRMLVQMGGGVVFFPSGEYNFHHHIKDQGWLRAP